MHPTPDNYLGVASGVVMGITALPLLRAGIEWGWNMLGPSRAEERRAPSGYVTGRTAARILVGGVLGGAAFCVAFFGPQFLVRPFIADWGDYARTSFWTFIAVAAMVNRRRILRRGQISARSLEKDGTR